MAVAARINLAAGSELLTKETRPNLTPNISIFIFFYIVVLLVHLIGSNEMPAIILTYLLLCLIKYCIKHVFTKLDMKQNMKITCIIDQSMREHVFVIVYLRQQQFAPNTYLRDVSPLLNIAVH
jgi:predicted membrane protein